MLLYLCVVMSLCLSVTFIPLSFDSIFVTVFVCLCAYINMLVLMFYNNVKVCASYFFVCNLVMLFNYISN